MLDSQFVPEGDQPRRAGSRAALRVGVGFRRACFASRRQAMVKPSYALAIGSNRRSRCGSPADTVRAALAALGAEAPPDRREPLRSVPRAATSPMPAAIVASDLDPPGMLAARKEIERDFGRRPGRAGGRACSTSIYCSGRAEPMPKAGSSFRTPIRTGLSCSSLSPRSHRAGGTRHRSTVRQLLHAEARRPG
jgi:hypothetical protein